MTADDRTWETAVGESGATFVPAEIRSRLDIDAGDTLRWGIDEDDTLTVDVIHQGEGVFDDFVPVDAGRTNALDAEGDFGTE